MSKIHLVTEQAAQGDVDESTWGHHSVNLVFSTRSSNPATPREGIKSFLYLFLGPEP